MIPQISSAILPGIIVLTSDITRDVLGVINGVFGAIGDGFGTIDLTFDIIDDTQGMIDDVWRAIDEQKSAIDDAQGVSDDTQDIIDDVICIIFQALGVASDWKSGMLSGVRASRGVWGSFVTRSAKPVRDSLPRDMGVAPNRRSGRVPHTIASCQSATACDCEVTAFFISTPIVPFL